jgi:hypothetical protein
MSSSYFNDWISDIAPQAMQPVLPEAQDTEAMMDRVILLELLYHLDKRHDRNHPQHNTYTGLWQKYQNNGNHL